MNHSKRKKNSPTSSGAAAAAAAAPEELLVVAAPRAIVGSSSGEFKVGGEGGEQEKSISKLRARSKKRNSREVFGPVFVFLSSMESRRKVSRGFRYERVRSGGDKESGTVQVLELLPLG